MKKSIDNFLTCFCDILNLEKPKFSFDTTNFESDTMLAMCEPTTNTIYLRSNDTSPDNFFAIAHEARHLWQFKNNVTFYFADKSNRADASVENYNKSLAEIDANAFAVIMATNFLHLRPQFDGLDDLTKKKIFDRAKEIVDLNLF